MDRAAVVAEGMAAGSWVLPQCSVLEAGLSAAVAATAVPRATRSDAVATGAYARLQPRDPAERAVRTARMPLIVRYL